jgi:hypothetical protein
VKVKHIFVVVSILLLAAVVPVVAQQEGVSVVVAPAVLDAIAGTTAKIRVDVNIPTTAPNEPGPEERASPTMAREPTFTVTVTPAGSGTVSPATFVVPRNREGGKRAVEKVELTFTVSPGASGGDVQIVVEGTQAPRLLGVTYEGLPLFRGLGRMTLRAQPGGRVSPPATRPPFSPTAGAVNPTSDMIRRGAGIAALLAVLGLTNYVIDRARKPRGEPAKKEEARKPVRPEAKTGEKVERQTSGCKAIVAAQEYLCYGNGLEDSWIHLIVAAIPAEGSKIKFAGPIKLSSDCGPAYDEFIEEDKPDWFDLPTGSKFRYYKVRVPWEWKDREVRFKVQLQGKLSTSSPLTRDDKITEWNGTATLETAVRVLGANPKVFVTADPLEVNATGQNPINFKTELWLFYAEAPKDEIVTVTEVQGKINGVDWHQPGPSWTPPFLIQEPQYVETVALTIECHWTAGSLYDRSMPKKTEPIGYEMCEVSLRGCTAESKSETEFFVPLAETPLYASATIKDANGRLVNPLDEQCVSHQKVRLSCEVRDLSQGLPDDTQGWKLPPKPLIDLGMSNSSPAAARAAFSKAPVVHTVEFPVLHIDGGHVTTTKADGSAKKPGPPSPETDEMDKRRKFLFWIYKPNPNQDPIHDGPVVYKIVIDDGFGGKLELQGLSRVALGSLVLETGGPEFRVYENRPFGFDIKYEAGDHGHTPEAGRESKVELTWEFAVVNEQGDPLKTAGRGGRIFDMASRRFLVILGHTPKDRVIYYNPKDGEVRMIGMGEPEVPLDWERFMVKHEDVIEGWPKAAGLVSSKIRQEWRSLETFFKKEAALEWLPKYPSPATKPADLGPVWWDTTLTLSVRFELRKDKQLIATSDRLAAGVGSAGRTPYDLVWRDHCFRFVLLTLRLYMQDTRGKPYAGLYRLEIDGTDHGGEITDQGIIETLVPAEAEHATLTLYTKGDARNGPNRGRFSLKLGYLDEAAQGIGAEGRLNNLGLFASREVTGKTDAEQFKRAVQRFQQLCRLETSGDLNPATVKKLQEVHDYGANLPEPSQTVDQGKP